MDFRHTISRVKTTNSCHPLLRQSFLMVSELLKYRLQRDLHLTMAPLSSLYSWRCSAKIRPILNSISRMINSISQEIPLQHSRLLSEVSPSLPISTEIWKTRLFTTIPLLMRLKCTKYLMEKAISSLSTLQLTQHVSSQILKPRCLSLTRQPFLTLMATACLIYSWQKNELTAPSSTRSISNAWHQTISSSTA